MLNLLTLVEGQGGVPNTFPTRIWTPNLKSLFSKWLPFNLPSQMVFFNYLKIKVATPHFSHFDEELHRGDCKLPCDSLAIPLGTLFHLNFGLEVQKRI